MTSSKGLEMTFEQFKELLEFVEEVETNTKTGLSTHHFRARFQAQARQAIASEIFDRDQEGIRAYMHNELAHKIWDLCMQVFRPIYTVDDLRKVYDMGRYGCSFDYALRAVGAERGQA